MPLLSESTKMIAEGTAQSTAYGSISTMGGAALLHGAGVAFWPAVGATALGLGTLGCIPVYILVKRCERNPRINGTSFFSAVPLFASVSAGTTYTAAAVLGYTNPALYAAAAATGVGVGVGSLGALALLMNCCDFTGGCQPACIPKKDIAVIHISITDVQGADGDTEKLRSIVNSAIANGTPIQSVDDFTNGNSKCILDHLNINSEDKYITPTSSQMV